MTKLEKCKILKQKGFSYNALTGKIYNRFGKEITRKLNGYISISGSTHFKGHLFGHHYGWYYTYGNVDFDELDHINRDKSDNRISNLRIATRQENNWNSTGKGYYWHKASNKWMSCITLNNKQIYLGLFNTEDEARECYLKSKQKLHKI